MQTPNSPKVTAEHLGRNAYLYIRQSTLRQVVENTESTQRQYALRQRAVALGWRDEQIIVIDKDLGQSAASAKDRAGFSELVAEVGMGRAGIVLGLEVSRLARNNTDWHRLLEICALFKTLILDEDGIYDPADFNDRLLLGLKGTMSEAELHFLRARLRGGILNKARRGELRCRLPIGFVYDAANRVALDPDRQVQESVSLLFATFERTGTAFATVKYFKQHQLLFPLRPDHGPRTGEVLWRPLQYRRAITILHNPRYAGAYVYGRHGHREHPAGAERKTVLPREKWKVLLLDQHPGYISWADYERIQERIVATSKSFGQDRRQSPPREGPALLQGRVICGICGNRMTVRYHQRKKLVPTYTCTIRAMRTLEPGCQHIQGTALDDAIGKRLIELMTPMALELSLAVQDELRQRIDEADRLRHRQVESAQYEVDLARQRYLQVDPAHRLVADSLEADWNEKLRALEKAREDYDRGRKEDMAEFDDEQRKRILDLANDFPALWNDPATQHRERKRMVALLIEDVTLTRRTSDHMIVAQIRFRGGRTETLKVPAALNAWQLRQTPKEVIAMMDELLEKHSCSDVATILNERGLKTGAGEPFAAHRVDWARRAAGLSSPEERQRKKGRMSAQEIAEILDLPVPRVKLMAKHGQLKAHKLSRRGQWWFEPLSRQPEDSLPTQTTQIGPENTPRVTSHA